MIEPFKSLADSQDRFWYDCGDSQAAIKDAVKRIRAAGKSAGFLTGDRDEADAMFDMGFNFTAVGNDVSILSGVLTNLAAHFRK